MLKSDGHYNQHLQYAWNKYGSSCFEWIVLCVCDKEQLNSMEINMIQTYHSDDPKYGYNKTKGGDGTLGMSQESLDKKEKTMREKYYTDPEWMEKKRQTSLRQFQNEEFYNAYREYRSSEEFKNKERKSHEGHVVPASVRQKSIEAIQKPVRCVETGVVYANAKEASRL